MLLIDRYLLRQFSLSLAICFGSLTGLFIVIDAFNNLDEFVTQGAKQGGVLATVAEYYGYRSISFFDQTSGILTLIAAMFTIAGFQRHNELTALMAAGISKWRIVQPVIWAVAVVTLLAAVSRETLIPAIRGELSRDAKDMNGTTATKIEPRRDNHTDVYLHGREAIARDRVIINPNFRLPLELSAFGSQLVAERAQYQDASEQHPAGYLLEAVQQPELLLRQSSLVRAGEVVVITPADAPWLAADQCFVVSDVSFEQLVGGASWRQYSSTAELIAGLRNSSLDFGADVRVAVHKRLVQPLLDMTLLFLGLPLILKGQNRNMFLAIGLGIAAVVVFMIVVLGCQYLGGRYIISPALAAWCPLIVFVPAAVSMSDAMRS